MSYAAPPGKFTPPGRRQANQGAKAAQTSGGLRRDDLALESASPDDPRLPKPRGRTMRKPLDSLIERAKLEATKQSGGLVPEHIDKQHWACAACRSIYDTRERATDCCQAEANRVQICSKCCRRLSDCICVRRF